MRDVQNMIYWLVVEPYPSEKIYVFVSWDDEIPNINEKNIHVPKHQPVWLVHLAFNIWLRYG